MDYIKNSLNHVLVTALGFLLVLFLSPLSAYATSDGGSASVNATPFHSGGVDDDDDDDDHDDDDDDNTPPRAPTVNTLIANDTTPLITGTFDSGDAGGGFRVRVDGVTYRLGKGNLVAAGDNWSLAIPSRYALQDGTYNVTAQARDRAGNRAYDNTSNELTVDTVAPTVSIVPLATRDNTPPLSGAVNDPVATISVIVDGATYSATNNGDGTWTLVDNTIAELPDGIYDVVVTATDSAGNSGSDATTNELVIDATAPTVTITTQTSSDSTPALSGTIDDPAATVTVAINGTIYPATNNGDGTWTVADNTVAPLNDGTYDVVVTATDAAGNSGSDATTNELVIDATAPTVTITTQTSSDSTPALSGTIDDPAATVTVAINGTIYPATNNGDGTWTVADNTVAPLNDGTYDIVVTATDAAGNSGSDATRNELTIDSSAPAITVTPQRTSDATPALSGTVSDPTAVVAVTVGGTAYTATNNGDGTWTLADNTISPLSDGSYDVVATATDAGNNSGSDGTTNELTIDSGAPTVAVAPLTGNDATPALNGTVDDPAATVTVTVNGTAYAATNNGDGTWTLPDNTIVALPDGTYDIGVTATDSTGNRGTDGTTNELTVDTAAPTIAVTPQTSSDSTPALSGTIDDPAATVTVTVSGVAYPAANNGDGTWTLADDTISPLADGSYDVTVTATDIAGNSSSDATDNELTIDTRAPTITITPLTTSDTTPPLSGTVSDPAATITVAVNGTTYPATNNGDGTWMLPDNNINPLPEGSYEVVATATDGIGNSGSDGTTNELTIDNGVPAVTVTPLASNDSTPALDGTVDDPAAAVTVTVNGVSYPATNNGDGTWMLPDNTISPLADGTYDVIVTAADSVGNSGSDATTNELTIDTVAPTITVVPLTTSDSTPVLGGTVSDPAAAVTVAVNGTSYPATNYGNGTWILMDNTVTPPLADGSYDVSATATDTAGNSGSDDTSNELTVDSSGPVITVLPQTTSDTTPVLGGTVNDPAAAVSATVNGVTYAAINLGNGIWTLPDNTINPPLADGTYDVIATATDAALNTGSDGTVDELVINSGLAADSDGDGVTDVNDLDDDNDGVPDQAEGGGGVDTDGDGIPDSRDLDSDNDGLFDLAESGGDAVTLDSDSDGRIDSSHPVGSNGLADAVETAADSGIVDYNSDTLVDTPRDSDGDSVPDFRDLDSDNDSITDTIEAGDDDPDRNGFIGTGAPPVVDTDGVASGAGVTPVDTDGDGVADQRDVDADGDGGNDIVEAGGTDIDGDGRIDGFIDNTVPQDGYDDSTPIPALIDLPDTDSDGIPDYRDNDDVDLDAIPDSIDLDDDNDGIPDQAEGDGVIDTDGDGIPDSRDLDSDNDGLFDLVESGADAVVLDRDNDGRIDRIFAPGVNGLMDVVETAADSGIVDYNGDTAADMQRDSDGDLMPDFRDLDSDNDSITDVVEGGSGDPDRNSFIGTGVPPVVNPDGVAGGAGVMPSDFDSDGVPDYRDLDSDNDSIRDLVEAGGTDANGDGVIDSFTDNDNNGFDDVTPITNVVDLPNSDSDPIPDFRDVDSDNDGFTDAVEAGNTDNDGDGEVDNFNDGNGDGLDDVAAVTIMPLPDGDGDGLADYRDSDTPGIQGGSVSPSSDTTGNSDTIQTGLDGIGSFDPALLLLILSTLFFVRRNRGAW